MEEEEIYKREIKQAEEEFLSKLKEENDISQLEKIYKEKLKSARERYYKNVQKTLAKERRLKPKRSPRKEKVYPFVLKKMSTNLTLFQRVQYLLRAISFKITFKTKNSFRKHTPIWLIYTFIRIKIIVKRAKNSIIKSYDNMKNKIVRLFILSKEFIKNKMQFLIELVKKISFLIYSLLKKVKKEKDSKKEEVSSNQNK